MLPCAHPVQVVFLSMLQVLQQCFESQAYPEVLQPENYKLLQDICSHFSKHDRAVFLKNAL